MGHDLSAGDRRRTVVLAGATFGSVKSTDRSARVAERSLLAGLRPILVPSHDPDPPPRVRFGTVVLNVPGHGGAIDRANGNIYVVIAVRNGGTRLAVIHDWRAEVAERTISRPPSSDEFRSQLRDLYIPARDPKPETRRATRRLRPAARGSGTPPGCPSYDVPTIARR